MKINLPIILSFDDYHEFRACGQIINKVISAPTKIKYEELGDINDGLYHAIFYVNRDEKFKKLIKEFNEREDAENILEL